MIGEKFGKWTVLKESSIRQHSTNKKLYEVECGGCKVIYLRRLDNIKYGNQCKYCANKIPRSIIHGKHNTPAYSVWVAMKSRCSYEKGKHWNHYGGRGIKVCDRWIHSFENFINDMGERPSDKHQLDRIDNNGNYEPSNCRWVTASQNNKNRRSQREIISKEYEEKLNRLRLLLKQKEDQIQEYQAIYGMHIPMKGLR